MLDGQIAFVPGSTPGGRVLRSLMCLRPVVRPASFPGRSPVTGEALAAAVPDACGNPNPQADLADAPKALIAGGTRKACRL